MSNKIKSFVLITISIFLIGNLKAQSIDTLVIDEVIGVVGKNIILKSDIETQFMQFRMQNGIKGSETTVKCTIFEDMLYQKLLLHQGEVDSVEITEDQVDGNMDMRMRYYVNQFGSEDALEEFYGKSILKIKEEMLDLVREQMIAEKVQNDIIINTNVTPSEIKTYFKSFPKDSIPLISSKVEIGQIIKLPPISEEVRLEAFNRIKSFKKRVEEGEKFETLAILYSEDAGSAKKGGELGMTSRGTWYPEFEAAAFLTEVGQLSDIIKTEAGYHLIQGIDRRGDYVNVRHILVTIQPSPYDLENARTILDSAANLITMDSLSFDLAVKQFSDDPGKNTGGNMINPATGTASFMMEELDPAVSFIIDKLEVGEISAPVPYRTEDNKDAYRILQLQKRTLPHKANLKEDYDKIHEWTLMRKNSEVINEWIGERIKKTYIRVNEDYKSCSLKNKWY